MKVESFESKRAFHAMQAAQKVMQESQDRMMTAQHKTTEIYHEIGDLQADFDKAKLAKDAEWAEFTEKLESAKLQIGEKINAITICNQKEEEFKKLSEDKELPEEHRAIYAEGMRFFSKLASQKMLERDDLITKKRQMVAPDMSKLTEMKERLKSLRKEQEEILEQYHEAKSDFGLRKASFDRAKAKYDALKNPDSNQDISAFSSRPQRMELDKSLLTLAKIPKEYWTNCTMERRADGKVDIYYGGAEGIRHGHAIIAGDSVEFSRKPEKVSKNA